MPRIKPPIFDEEKLAIGHDHAKYKIEYYVFFSETDTAELPLGKFLLGIKEKIKNSNFACFAQLLSLCNQYRNKYKKFPNRVRYVCKRNQHPQSKLHLNTEEIRRWTELCKQNKLLPETVGNNFIENGCFDIQIDHLSKEMMYLYLSTARYVQDEPFFVRAILHMVDDNKMGFFTSFAVATTFCTTNSGHHIIEESRTYSIMGFKKNLNDPKPSPLNNFQVLRVAQLANFVNQPDTAAPISKSVNGWGSYNLHGRLQSVKLKTIGGGLVVAKKDLRRKALEKAILSGDLTKPLIKRRKKGV